jgi:SAM-dependent methyltransferase
MERLKKPPAPKLIKQRRAFSSMGGPVDVEGEGTAARTLASLFDVDPARERALTHGFHSYAGRMHPSMARAALLAWSQAGDRVLDPFCGSGTVLVEAATLGRAAQGVDASPLAVLIAEVRTTPLGPEGRARLIETATRIGEASSERARKRQRPEIPLWARRETERFAPHVSLELLGLRQLVMDTPEDDVGKALRLCFSSLLVKFMRAGPEAPRDGANKRIARGLPSGFFASRAGELARSLEDYERAVPPKTPAPSIRLGDARSYTHIKSGSINLIVSSPPYAGTYDYAGLHETRFLWLGLSQSRFDKAQVGARAMGLGANPRSWEESRVRWLSEISRVLVPGGHAVLIVGDGVVGERLENAAISIADEVPPLKLTAVARASQPRPIRDSRLRELVGPAPRFEHAVLLRRQ